MLTWSSLGSATGTKFGVFGYCYTTNDTCSGIEIGYDPDNILNNVPASSLVHSSPKDNLQRRKAASTLNNGNQSPFNLPANARNNLTNILVVHVVAAGLTFFLFIMSIFGHLERTRDSSAYLLASIILSVPTVILTLLAFLVDILIFVPNLDWGTWVTLGATILNSAASISICASRRRLGTRKAMRARIAENDAINSQSYYNSQHLQDPEPEQDMLESDKATLPRFAQFEMQHRDSDVETVRLNMLDHDGRSVRSDTPSRSSPPRYPQAVDGYMAPSDMHPGSSPYAEPDYRSIPIPYGNPPRQPDYRSQNSRALEREPLCPQTSNSELDLQAPLAHSDAITAQRYVRDWEATPANAGIDMDELPPEDRISQDQSRMADDEWNQGDARAYAPRPSRGRRQRVVSGPRVMPGARRIPVRSASDHGSYHEDVPPQFDQAPRFADEEYIQNRLPNHGSRRHRSQRSNSFERPPYPEQPRSPDAVSNSSHFTSVSQRGINPRWHGEAAQPGMPVSRSQGTIGRPYRAERRQQPNILADNPDFILPGVGGRTRLPQSRRPGAVPGLSTGNLGIGQSPYAITKGV